MREVSLSCLGISANRWLREMCSAAPSTSPRVCAANKTRLYDTSFILEKLFLRLFLHESLISYCHPSSSSCPSLLLHFSSFAFSSFFSSSTPLFFLLSLSQKYVPATIFSFLPFNNNKKRKKYFYHNRSVTLNKTFVVNSTKKRHKKGFNG